MTLMSGWREVTATLDGVRIAHRVRDGGPPVMMVHGIGPGTTAQLNFSPVLQRLPAELALYLVDLAGFGGSGRLQGGNLFNVEFWLRQLECVLDDILAAHAKAPLLVGNSAGAALMLKLAARRREPPGVVAIGTAFAPPTAALRRFWMSPTSAVDLAHALRPMTAREATPDLAALQARLLPFMQGDYAAYFNAMLADPDEALRRLRLLPAEAAAISARVVLVHGRQDRACLPLPVVQELLALLPGADLHLLGGCGHNVPAERPADVAGLIDDLLNELGAA